MDTVRGIILDYRYAILVIALVQTVLAMFWRSHSNYWRASADRWRKRFWSNYDRKSGNRDSDAELSEIMLDLPRMKNSCEYPNMRALNARVCVVEGDIHIYLESGPALIYRGGQLLGDLAPFCGG